MKTKLQLTIAAFTLAVFGQNVAAQSTFTYDFNTDLNGVVTAAAGAGIRERGIPGTAPTPLLTDNGVANTSGVLIQRQYNLFHQNRNTNVNDLTLFPAAVDYSITWKEYVTKVPDGTTTSHRRGFLVRGRGTATYSSGLKSGYYVGLVGDNTGKVTFQVRNVVNDNLTVVTPGTVPNIFLDGGTTALSINKAYWYRITVTGSSPVVIKVDYSLDGITFTNGLTYNDTSNLYPDAGLTQTVSGIGFASYDWQILDDIVFRTGASLGTQDVKLSNNSVSVFKNDNSITINSSDVTIQSVELFDISGRVLARKNNVNALETSFTNLNLGKGLVLVQVTGADGSIQTRKVAY